MQPLILGTNTAVTSQRTQEAPTWWLSKLGDTRAAAMKIQGSVLIKTKKTQQQDNPSFLELTSARGSPPPLCLPCVSVKPKLAGLFRQHEDKHTSQAELLSFLNLDKPVLHSPLVLLDKQVRKVKQDPMVPGSSPAGVMKAKVTESSKDHTETERGTDLHNRGKEYSLETRETLASLDI